MKRRSTMVWAVVVCACFMLMCSFAGCTATKDAGKEVKKTEQTKAQKAKLAQQKKRKAKADERKEHERYENLASSKIRSFKAKVNRMKAGIGRASGQTKARMTRDVRELDKRLRDVEVSYRKMTSAGAANWQKERLHLDRSINSFEHYYARVSSANK